MTIVRSIGDEDLIADGCGPPVFKQSLLLSLKGYGHAIAFEGEGIDAERGLRNGVHPNAKGRISRAGIRDISAKHHPIFVYPLA